MGAITSYFLCWVHKLGRLYVNLVLYNRLRLLGYSKEAGMRLERFLGYHSIHKAGYIYTLFYIRLGLLLY